jgi:hypothetical protein
MERDGRELMRLKTSTEDHKNMGPSAASVALATVCVTGTLFAVVALALSACDSSTTSSSTIANPNAPVITTPAPASSPVTPTQIGTVDNASGFTVYGIFQEPPGSTNVVSFLHEQSSLTSPCAVQSGTPAASADIFCILDVAEEDLYDNALTLNWNVPAGMCPYTRTLLYSFYQYQPGAYPNPTITANVASDGGCTNTVPANAFPDGACSGAPVCAFDYSTQLPVAGPNCCTGTTNITTITQPAPNPSLSPNPAVTTTSTYTFTGNQANCISGPDVDVSGYGRGPGGYPRDTIQRTIDAGVNTSVTMTSPINKTGQGSNIYVANYFDPAFIGGAPANTLSTFPPALTTDYPIADGSSLGPALPGTSPYYTFTCEDEAADTVARIRILVRSWDRVSDFTANSNPYDPGTEPVFGGQWNDFSVWENYVSTYVGSSM